MPPQPLTITPIQAPVRQAAFDLFATLQQALNNAETPLQEGDVLAVSSKYCAIAEGRVIALDDIEMSAEGTALAERYQMNPRIAQLVLQEADQIFGGIPGFLLTHKDGIVSPNAGIDRSNIPNGYAVLFPRDPYASARALREQIRAAWGVRVGVILTDSWLMPGRWGTTGVALACAGFQPLQDERGKHDLFGNPMQVTQRGIADTLCICAQAVMGERDEATPFAVLRHTNVVMTDEPIRMEQVAIPWAMCIYIRSLTSGLREPIVISEDGVRLR